MQTSRPADKYSPLYFLASLGAGGLTVTFFMFLMFWVPHPGQPVPIFEDIAKAFATGGVSMQVAIAVAMAGIAVMAFTNIRLLIWNFRELGAFQQTDAWAAMTRSNAETQVLAGPLAAAMTVNVGFILGLVFVPGLWGVVEYLFPLAMAAFMLIGIWALRLTGRFLRRVLSEGGFDMKANNSFAQMMPAFALAMVGVGLAAPVAMSLTPLTAGIAIALTLFFITLATIGTVIEVVTPRRLFTVELKNGLKIPAHISRESRAKGANPAFEVGDEVTLEFTPYDFSKARIACDVGD